MAHFAELDENNVVLRVIVINNGELLKDGVETEEYGIKFCQMLYGETTKWIQTSYNHNFRGSFASIGGIYDPVQDIFILPEENLPLPISDLPDIVNE